jgi:hypothetical protein
MLEYQQAWQMPAQRKFLTVTLKHVETFVDMSTDAKRFILYLEREMFVDHVKLKMFHHVMQ